MENCFVPIEQHIYSEYFNTLVSSVTSGFILLDILIFKLLFPDGQAENFENINTYSS